MARTGGTRLGGPRLPVAITRAVHARRSGRPRRAAYGRRSTTLQPRAITIRKRDMCSSGSDRLLVEKKEDRYVSVDTKRTCHTECTEHHYRGLNCRDRIIVSTCQQPPPHARDGCSATRRNTQTFPDVPGLYGMRRVSSWRRRKRTGSLLAHQTLVPWPRLEAQQRTDHTLARPIMHKMPVRGTGR